MKGGGWAEVCDVAIGIGRFEVDANEIFRMSLGHDKVVSRRYRRSMMTSLEQRGRETQISMAQHLSPQTFNVTKLRNS